jgi:CheY-like chemotaxis protein
MSANALRILIVDDERELAEGLAEMLTLLGYPVEIAADEQDALVRARAQAFDIAFVDSRMPTMHGSELFFEIKEIMPTARVVMMTGFREPILDRALQAGAEGPLLKPFSIKDMLKTIDGAP